MENKIKTSRDKYFVQKVGSAVQYEKGTDKEHFRCTLNRNELLKCTIRTHRNRETASDFEVFNLSLKSINDPSGPATHLVTDSLYHKSKIDDNLVEVNLHLEKNRISSVPADRNGIFYTKVERNDKNSERYFNLLDYKVYLTDDRGEKINENAYLGYANRVNRERDYKRQHTYDARIEREFIGSGFIVQDENNSTGQALMVKSNKEKLLNTVSENQPFIYVNIIPVKNNPQQMAAYVTRDVGDKAARFIFRLDKEKVKLMQAGNEGYIKFSGYFDENANNNSYNIIVRESLSQLPKSDVSEPMVIGVGADKGNTQSWQDLRFQRDEFANQKNLNTGKNFNL